MTLPELITIDICKKEDGFKDKCLRLPIKGCDGCWYHGIQIIPKKMTFQWNSE